MPYGNEKGGPSLKPFYLIVFVAVCFITVHGFAGAPEGGAAVPQLIPVWTPAQTDKNGDVIAVRVKYNGKGEGHRVGEDRIPVRTNYGFAMVYRESLPKAFYIFDNAKKKYFATRDFELFYKQLEAIPKGQCIAWVECCTVASYNDLPEPQKERVFALLKKNRLETEECSFPSHFCYCTATSIQWLDVPGDKGYEPCEWVFCK